ncbi:MAG: hypothetical protein K2I08_01355 [Muribaculaceae bacterium]|nr:hypothetical protein [Muribaculaceae bacterium]
MACLAMLGSCQDEIQPIKETPFVDDSDTFTVGVSLSMAEFSSADTRAFSNTLDYRDMDLHVIEFELGEDPFVGSNLTNNYTDKIKMTGVNGDDNVDDMHFDLTLYKAFEPRVLHFIAVPKGTELNIPLGQEGSVIPSLFLSDNTPAYWKRLEFKNGYGDFNSDGDWVQLKDLQLDLTHIPMISNFAKISLTATAASNFSLEGFQVMNQPKSGYIAPWDAEKGEFPDFLNGSSMLSYADIDAYYKGRSPNNQALVTKASETTFDDPSPKFIYERQASSINNPFVIMKGRRNGIDTESKYYKLDLGHFDGENLFEYYDLIRNFNYAVNITKVEAEGYSTAQEALEGVVFNNFSFDVNTKQMLNVSNGEDMMWVNQTTFVVTDEEETTVTFRYRYMKDITNGGGTVGTNEVLFKNLVPDEENGVITSVNYGAVGADGWRDVTITTVSPTTTRKEQTFIAYNPTTGLGRSITIVVRTPWLYTDAGVWGGNYNYYQQFIDNVAAREEWNGFVSSDSDLGQPLTVRFHIDDNLPEAIFPLTFTFESNRQNIENNKVGNLQVEYGSSYFDPTKRTIKYSKTVTWANYNSKLTEDDELGTIVDDNNDGITSHVVRARFQTIAPIVTGQVTNIRIYNPYMRVSTDAESQYLEVSFRGKEGEAPNYE